MRFNELREALALRMSDEAEDSRLSLRESSAETRNFRGAKGDNRFTDDELKTVISLLAGPGVVWELGFGSWILLQPELINSHAQAVIRSLQRDERELGCIAETQVLSGDRAFAKENPRLEAGEERIVLLAMHQILVEHGLCLRDEDPEQKSPTMLVFPSYARRARPELVEYPSVIVSYHFNGFLDDIYATLVVRLHHTQPFDIEKSKHEDLPRHAEYWAAQAFPVMLVIMNSKWEFASREWQRLDGTEIRWMEIRDHLRANPARWAGLGKLLGL